MQRYLVGTETDLNAVRGSLDRLAGYPRRTPMPSPPAAEEYSEGAMGWVGHLIGAPFAVDATTALLEMPDDAVPYAGQTSESVTVPSEDQWTAREALPPAYQTALDEREAGGL
jgi:hypothetical protein